MSSLRLLSRDEVLNVDDTKYDEVETPEWGEGVGVRVRSLTAFEKDALESAMVEVRKNKATVNPKAMLSNFRAKLCAMAIVDEDGKSIFGEIDVFALGKKNAAPIGRISEAIQKLSRISEEDIDEMVGNSETDQEGDSPTA